MCNKCNEEIKAALDHVVVAALKLARLTGHAYRVRALEGLFFSIAPDRGRAEERGHALHGAAGRDGARGVAGRSHRP
jgi:hypothetical protein